MQHYICFFLVSDAVHDDKSNSLDPSLDISTDLRKFDPVDVCLEQRPAHDAISKCDVS